MTELKTIYDAEGLPNKFIAIYANGSGVAIFVKCGDDAYREACDETGFDFIDRHYFPEPDYHWYIPLPDDFKVWGE